MKISSWMTVFAGAALLVLTACVSKREATKSNASPNSVATPSQPAVTQFVIKKPASADDIRGWRAYLGALLSEHLEGMTAPQPYAYFIPPGDDADSVLKRAHQLDNLRVIVARGIVPGNLVIIAGPDSAVTADVILDGFRDQLPNSCKGVILVFVGDKADWPRVAEAWQSTGAILRFVDISIPPRPVRLPIVPAHAASSGGGTSRGVGG
jgi:hypothetical protein